MFSASLELILNVAYREAASRRHTHLTLEHLLYALTHDPEGERILAACGADLPDLRRTLDEFLGTLETFARGEKSQEPAQTSAAEPPGRRSPQPRGSSHVYLAHHCQRVHGLGLRRT